MYKVWEVKRMHLVYIKESLTVGASKLCTSMCLRLLMMYKSSLLYMQYSTAMQYADSGLHNHKDRTSFVC